MSPTSEMTAPPQDAAQTSEPDSPAGESSTSASAPKTSKPKTGGSGLTAMRLPELRALGQEMGIAGVSSMRKADLISAIRERRGAGSSGAGGGAQGAGSNAGSDSGANSGSTAGSGAGDRVDASPSEQTRGPVEQGGEGQQTARQSEGSSSGQGEGQRDQGRGGSDQQGKSQQADGQQGQQGQGQRNQGQQQRQGQQRQGQGGQQRQGQGQGQGGQQRQGQRGQQQGGDGGDDGDGNRRRRNRRDRNRRGRDRMDADPDNPPGDDETLQPVAGILDIFDNYAFVRTGGYLNGPNDVYVSLGFVRRFGLRRGDAVTGAVRPRPEGEQRREKYNPLVRLDSVNGMGTDESKKRPEFHTLTPLYPQERLRLENDPAQLTPRVIDLVMPMGKGQRALVVSPPKAGKTMVLQAIANAITHNNPECHLMVVLVDERPEEVTDMQRSVKGEVIASTFDRPPSDHCSVAELAIERAKRLVELGHDVVVLLDSITRLGRAYNLAAPASGRILSGGVDSTALYPPKKFLGAARNIENGGSLTIVATALVETGSTMDTVIFEEFKGTGNAELKLDRRLADKRMFPAVDVDASGTRKEEILLSPEELNVTIKLRRVLAALDKEQALDLVRGKLKNTSSNYEFLMQVAKTTPGE